MSPSSSPASSPTGWPRASSAAADPAVAGRAVLQASALFHHPAHAREWAEPGLDAALEAVLDLLLEGLRPRG
ncbi:MAG: hypothetical protein ACM3XQ_01345 [Nocardioidaceae bacterium]